MYSKLRRIVTGHDENGKSCIVIAGPTAESYIMGAGGLFEIWDSGGKEISSTESLDRGTVSYTHLTLPTILLV